MLYKERESTSKAALTWRQIFIHEPWSFQNAQIIGISLFGGVGKEPGCTEHNGGMRIMWLPVSMCNMWYSHGLTDSNCVRMTSHTQTVFTWCHRPLVHMELVYLQRIKEWTLCTAWLRLMWSVCNLWTVVKCAQNFALSWLCAWGIVITRDYWRWDY